MIKITASIVVYNNSIADLEKTIKSFLDSSVSGELFIIDNSPTPVAQEICEAFHCHYVFTGSNLGYGKAHNIAIRKTLSYSPYHLVLNPDVYFGPDVLEKLLNYMEENPKAGLIMPNVLYPDGTTQRLCKLLPTPFNLATRRFLPSGIEWLKKINDRYEMSFAHHNKVMNVPFLSGCFMFLRTAALQKTGLFDERFLLYAEDTDLSRRIHQKFNTIFFPFAEIYHTHARGSYKNIKLTWHNLKSAIQYFNKWGWFFDKEREMINEAAMTTHLSKKNESMIVREKIIVQQPVNE
jgi:GT2 family glycosyltransferase